MKEAGAERFLGLVPVDWRLELTALPMVRRALRSRWTTFLGITFNLFVFIVILSAGVLGTQVGNRNFGIMIVWILWWSALMLVLLPFASRLWCGVCPLPAFGEWLSRLRLVEKGPEGALGRGLKWPKSLKNMWLVNFVFFGVAIFSGIITTRPWATTLMLGIIILVSVAVHLLYERRTFCRYLCPVGGFLGLYSNFSAMEVRSKKLEVCRSHRTKECYVGSQCGYGCPWLEVPMTMQRNTYCGMCFECFRSCSLDNMALNIRPFGTDLLVDRHRGLDESWKAFIMLGAAALYSVTMMGPWGLLKDWANVATWGGFLGFALIFGLTVFAVVPGVHAFFAWLSGRLSGAEGFSFRKLFLDYSYPLVVMGLAAWVAFSMAIILPNGSYVIPVLSDPFGLGWNLFGTAEFPWTPFLTGWLPHIQIAIMFLGLLYSLDIAWKISTRLFKDRRQARKALVSQVLYMGLLTAVYFWLFIG